MKKNYITISIYTEFLQEALFSMKVKCKDLIGKKEVDFFLCEKSGKNIYSSKFSTLYGDYRMRIFST